MARKRKKRNTWVNRTGDRIRSWFTAQRTRHLSRFTRISLALILIATAGILVLRRLDTYVNTLPTVTSSQVVVSFHDKPEWMSSALAREILQTAAQPVLQRLTDAHRRGEDHLLPRVLAQQLQDNGWIRNLKWVRRSGGGQLVVNCEFRRPAATVVKGRTYYLVDPNACLLPGEYTGEALRECGLIEIRGCTGSPPAAGKQWAKNDMLSGLKVATLIAATPFRHQVRAVNVANFGGRLDPAASRITLITDRKTIIRWGAAPGGERGLQIPAKEKLAVLAGFYRRHGHIDDGRAWVDIRWSRTEVDVSIASAGSTDR